MQIWPALNVYLRKRSRATAVEMFAVLSTKTGHLPPHSRVTGVMCLAAAAITILPTMVEPVYMMWSHRSSSSADASFVEPCTMRTASEGRYRGKSSPRSLAVAGDISDGLITAQLPAASTAASGDMMRLMGKFQAPMMSTTPLGSLRTNERPSAYSCGIFSSAAHLSRFFSISSMFGTENISPMTRTLPPPTSDMSASAMASTFSDIICSAPARAALRHDSGRVAPDSYVARTSSRTS
mmetsp:Transcript_17526/g.51857  ORF Transcript_17526/g.51857 Transcript_17526/m.51857 type:complete len:238 (-) Transcript_17526:110-823(-)